MGCPPKYKTAKEQILSNIQYQENGCWLWVGTKPEITGYIKVKRTIFGKEFRVYSAHQLSYIVFNGEYNRALLICHKCNIRNCVNPGHLYAGTAKQNQEDKARAGSVKGVLNPFAKLNDHKVRGIRYWITRQLSDGAIGLLFGTDKSNINLIRNGKAWTHVT